MPEELDGLQNNLLEIIDYFHQFCEANNLEYFLIGGTLIGAVRHQGFIPWDDDIDVVMSRKNYEKLLKLHDEIKNPFKLRDYRVDQEYAPPFARLVNNNLIIEQSAYIPIQSGVWIDIFPLDNTFENLFAQKLHFAIAKSIRVLLSVKCGAFNKTKRSAFRFNIVKSVFILLKIVPKSAFIKTLGFIESAPAKLFNAKVNYANLYGAWGVKETAPVILFDNKKLYDFEDYKFWSIENADFWLKKVYGDYMTLPPESERAPKHFDRIVK